MAFKQTNIHYGRSSYDSNDLKSETAEVHSNLGNLSISTVISRSCTVLDDFQDLACPTGGTSCQTFSPRSSLYPTPDHNKLPETDYKLTASSGMITPITDRSDNSGLGYNNLSIDTINSEPLFEIPSTSFAPCNHLAPTDPTELVHNFMESSSTSYNTSIIDWAHRPIGDPLSNVRQHDSHGATLVEENRNKRGTLKYSANFDCSTQGYGHAQSNTFYGNVESHKMLYDNEIHPFYQQNNHLGHFGGNMAGRMESYNDLIHGETDQPSCVLQNASNWRADYTLQYQACKTPSSSTGNSQSECCPDELLYRKYNNDDSLFDSRFQHPGNVPSESLLTSPIQSTSPTTALDGHFMHPQDTMEPSQHFLLASSAPINAPFHRSGRSSLDGEVEEDRQSEPNRTEASHAFHYGKTKMHQSGDLKDAHNERHRASQANSEMESNLSDRTNRKCSAKVKSKKPDSVESLQHQLELLEEKRRMGSTGRPLAFRCHFGTSDDEKAGQGDVNSIIDVDHMISSGVTVAGFKPRAIIRKRSKSNTPSDVKNQDYWHKRRKNNDSARKSRESKKEKEKNFYKRALELEYENTYLLECLNLAEAELASLGRQFIPPAFDQDSYY